jgi:hypothetical protein
MAEGEDGRHAVERSDSLRLARIDANGSVAPAGSGAPAAVLRMRSLTACAAGQS